jgi:hypothetical protein
MKKNLAKRLESIDKKLGKIEEEERRINEEEESIEKSLLRVGRLSVKKEHVFELIRAGAGAFLGVGLGRSLLGLDNVAKTLPWANVFGILVFVLGLSSLLIYKDEKENIKAKGKRIVLQRLVFVYFIAIFIEFISLLLFNVSYDSTGTLIKILVVGSFTAMASAVTFSLAK